MFRTLLIASIALVTTAFSAADASAQARRHRLHSRWISGVGTSYLTASDYDSCWATSQHLVAPSQATIDIRFRSCLSRNRIHMHRRRHVRARIRANCRTEANAAVLPSEIVQQNSYVRCLRHRRYNYIRNYLTTVTCGHLLGRAYSHCTTRLYRDISKYGYSSAAHLNYLDNLYRTRYRGFRTRHPNHRFVKRYHSVHHSPRRVHPTRRVHPAPRHAVRNSVRREVRREVRRQVRREARKEARKEARRRAVRKAVKREVRKERRRAVKREVRRDRRRRH